MPNDRDAAGRMSRRNVSRTKRAVQAFEASPLAGGASPATARPFAFGVQRAKVTTAIPSGTFDSPSTSGRARIYTLDPDGSWKARLDPVVVFNQNTGATIPVDRPIMLCWIAGQWWLLTGSCA